VSKLPKKIVMATGNPGKIREIARVLDGLGVEIIAQSEFGVADADETGTTFAENSLIKARHAAAATGLPAIADDSGLAVDALGGAPGVYSARYAGPECDDEANNDHLLAALEGVNDRAAAFHCVATYIEPTGEAVVAEGVWRGSILHARQGDDGFGYDPVFFVPDCGCSSAELSPEEKNRRSHRGQALRKLVELIRQKYA
jgi:XTP/dITP diphosphohydrolase